MTDVFCTSVPAPPVVLLIRTATATARPSVFCHVSVSLDCGLWSHVPGLAGSVSRGSHGGARPPARRHTGPVGEVAAISSSHAMRIFPLHSHRPKAVSLKGSGKESALPRCCNYKHLKQALLHVEQLKMREWNSTF